MKVLNLQCSRQHVFEGWFASEEEFQSQRDRALVECPLCGDNAVAKLPSAPRLNLGATRAAPAAAGKADVVSMPDAPMQAAWMKMVRHVIDNTEDVGERFAEEARRIHYGEREERAIRGRASADETRELLEEGVPVLPLPIPKGLKGPLQ